jgi:CheY-like chemotaxis protein
MAGDVATSRARSTQISKKSTLLNDAIGVQDTMMEAKQLNYISTEQPRIMVVDGSKVVRRLLEQLLKSDLPEASVIACATGAEALLALDAGAVDLVSTALRLPDMDGMELARHVREHATQAYVPIVIVSGDVDERLANRELSDHVTDYFDKGLGLSALAAFIRGYVRPETQVTGTVLYVEDSRVVAVTTQRLLERHGFSVQHVTSVEDALVLLHAARDAGAGPGIDVVLSDVSLQSKLTGGDLLDRVRAEFGYGKGELPVLIMSGDQNPRHQATLLRAGANDLVLKPVDERLLITKLAFQTRIAQDWRARHEHSV